MSTSNLHLRLLTLAVAHMKERGMTNIKADGVPGYSQPDEIVGFRPDATGFYQGRPAIVEAETTQGLDASHTFKQMQAFYRHAKSVQGWLILAVFAADKSTAEVLLNNAAGRDAIVWIF